MAYFPHYLVKESRRPPYRKLKSPARWKYGPRIAERLRRLGADEQRLTGSGAAIERVLIAWEIED